MNQEIGFVVDDEFTPYVENVIDHLKQRGYEVVHIDQIGDAWERFDELMESRFVVVDLMMPQTDEEREVPSDPVQVGIELCETLADKSYRGTISVMTNADKDGHAQLLHKLKECLDKRGEPLAFKPETNSLAFVNKVVEAMRG